MKGVTSNPQERGPLKAGKGCRGCRRPGEREPVDFVVSYSCGKDSALALYRMLEERHRPVGLLVMINDEQDRSWFHGVDRPLLEAVSHSLKIPLLLCPCPGEGYAAAMEKGLVRAREMGARVAVFGDIDIEEHRHWCRDRCRAAGLSALFPLWGEDRRALTREVIDLGFRALIKVVNKSKTATELLGQTLTHDLVRRIAAGGADPCGENGEYHTFVYDGPIFAYPLPVETGAVLDFGTHAAIDLRLSSGAQH